MIYSFAIGDERKDWLLQVLKQEGIDYELIERDTVVVRILGAISIDLKCKLEFAEKAKREIEPTHGEKTDCFEQIIERSQLTVIAGPCAVEDEEQLAATAAFLKGLGVRYLRGGAYKPRTSSYSFQGLGKPGLEMLRRQANLHGMYVVTEVMDRSQIDIVAEYADILQVGSRNMSNYTLLTALGSIQRPVLLKRGMAATVDEWLSASEYIRRGGNEAIILCERGIRTFEPQVAHTLDIAAMLLAKQQSPFPVIADPSHAAGRSDLVAPLACAAVAAGADGVMIEVHPQPTEALSDGKQALDFSQFESLWRDVNTAYAARRNG